MGSTKQETHTVTMITVRIYVLFSTTRSLDFSNLSSRLGITALMVTHWLRGSFLTDYSLYNNVDNFRHGISCYSHTSLTRQFSTKNLYIRRELVHNFVNQQEINSWHLFLTKFSYFRISKVILERVFICSPKNDFAVTVL